jgi:hypothetical protein
MAGDPATFNRTAIHGTFTVERDLAASPDQVYAAYGDAEQYAYLAYPGDGSQDIAHLKGSMNLQLNGLAAALNATG